jgi:NTP pyrophosphatase (non-canonical NTP hydrolase)
MKNYQELALVTDHKSYEHVSKRFTPSMSRLNHAALGLSTEANEFADQLKKHLIYGKELDKVNLIEELGDICWFIAMACDELGTNFEEIQEINIKKLKARYGEKYSDDKAINRNLNKERNILENND